MGGRWGGGLGDWGKRILIGGWGGRIRIWRYILVAGDKYLAEHPGGAGSAEAMYLRGRAVEQRTKYSDNEVIANLRQARGIYDKALEASPSRFLESYIRTSLGNVSYWLGDYAASE